MNGDARHLFQKSIEIIGADTEGPGEAEHGRGVRTLDSATFEIAQRANADPGSFGQVLLAQPAAQTQPPQLFVPGAAAGRRGVHPVNQTPINNPPGPYPPRASAHTHAESDYRFESSAPADPETWTVGRDFADAARAALLRRNRAWPTR